MSSTSKALLYKPCSFNTWTNVNVASRGLTATSCNITSVGIGFFAFDFFDFLGDKKSFANILK